MKTLNIIISFFVGKKFWTKESKNRPTKQDIDLIYKRKDKVPIQKIKFANNQEEHF
ncbi:MAG: hypothetical protein QFY14_02860 [Candidatus Phytoplasma pruni]|nr:hypothetical protein [Candidatus Phytoplasma pruni]MCQ9618453.1 sucrose phosphorylase [Candidatus Phytoplasma pruni]MDW3618006.1 hypothetical protein [Candidatus Phytoplasma pruni]